MTGAIKALALAGSLTVAGGAAASLHSGPFQRLARIHDEFHAMNLSPDQKRDIHEILRARRAEVRAAADRVYAAHQAVGEAIHRQPVDEPLIRQRVASAAIAAADLAVLRAQLHAQVREVLTPEQNASADQIHGEIRAGIGELRTMARSFMDEHLNHE